MKRITNLIILTLLVALPLRAQPFDSIPSSGDFSIDPSSISASFTTDETSKPFLQPQLQDLTATPLEAKAIDLCIADLGSIIDGDITPKLIDSALDGIDTILTNLEGFRAAVTEVQYKNLLSSLENIDEDLVVDLKVEYIDMTQSITRFENRSNNLLDQLSDSFEDFKTVKLESEETTVAEEEKASVLEYVRGIKEGGDYSETDVANVFTYALSLADVSSDYQKKAMSIFENKLGSEKTIIAEVEKDIMLDYAREAIEDGDYSETDVANVFTYALSLADVSSDYQKKAMSIFEGYVYDNVSEDKAASMIARVNQLVDEENIYEADNEKNNILTASGVNFVESIGGVAELGNVKLVETTMANLNLEDEVDTTVDSDLNANIFKAKTLGVASDELGVEIVGGTYLQQKLNSTNEVSNIIGLDMNYGSIAQRYDVNDISTDIFAHLQSIGIDSKTGYLEAVTLIVLPENNQLNQVFNESIRSFLDVESNMPDSHYALFGNLNFLEIYSTLNIQNSISNFVNFLLGDVKESTRLIDTELDVDNKITFDSPGAIIKDILEKLNPKRTEEAAKLRLAMPKKIKLSHFVMLFFSLLIFSCSLGYSAGIYHIKSRKI